MINVNQRSISFKLFSKGSFRWLYGPNILFEYSSPTKKLLWKLVLFLHKVIGKHLDRSLSISMHQQSHFYFTKMFT